MTKQDALSRTDLIPSAHAIFDALDSDIQKVLKRAASRGTANLPEGMTLRILNDWIMVPSKRGLRQVVIGVNRAFVI